MKKRLNTLMKIIAVASALVILTNCSSLKNKCEDGERLNLVDTTTEVFALLPDKDKVDIIKYNKEARTANDNLDVLCKK